MWDKMCTANNTKLYVFNFRSRGVWPSESDYFGKIDTLKRAEQSVEQHWMVTLHWVVQNVLTLLQQLLLFRWQVSDLEIDYFRKLFGRFKVYDFVFACDSSSQVFVDHFEHLRQKLRAVKLFGLYFFLWDLDLFKQLTDVRTVHGGLFQTVLKNRSAEYASTQHFNQFTFLLHLKKKSSRHRINESDLSGSKIFNVVNFY